MALARGGAPDVSCVAISVDPPSVAAKRLVTEPAPGEGSPMATHGPLHAQQGSPAMQQVGWNGGYGYGLELNDGSLMSKWLHCGYMMAK